MNEQIKELAEQAYQLADAETRGQYEKWHTDKTLPLPTPFNEAYEQKFAELIVKECLKQTELARCSFNSQPQYTDKQNALVDEGFTWGADSCKDKIKQHFGVEE